MLLIQAARRNDAEREEKKKKEQSKRTKRGEIRKHNHGVSGKERK